MRINYIVSGIFAVLFLVICAGLEAAGPGSPNPTGGFGQQTTTTTDANPTGGFGTAGTSDPMPLESPPPPPEEPVPLDGGASLLIAAGVGFGAKKLYGQLKNKN